MNPEIKKKWLEALRSGEYSQGKSHLKAENFYCCLGVLCDLHAKEFAQSWQDPNDDGGSIYGESYFGAKNFLPHEVVKWADLPNDNPRAGEGAMSLSNYNDHGVSFEDIAGMIESGDLL